jgi:hypothetical protein
MRAAAAADQEVCSALQFCLLQCSLDKMPQIVEGDNDTDLGPDMMGGREHVKMTCFGDDFLPLASGNKLEQQQTIQERD